MEGLKDVAADIILISENLQAVIEAINGRLDNLYMRVEALEKADLETPPVEPVKELHIYSPELIREIKEEPKAEPQPEPAKEEPQPEPPKPEPKKEETKPADNIAEITQDIKKNLNDAPKHVSWSPSVQVLNLEENTKKPTEADELKKSQLEINLLRVQLLREIIAFNNKKKGLGIFKRHKKPFNVYL